MPLPPPPDVMLHLLQTYGRCFNLTCSPRVGRCKAYQAAVSCALARWDNGPRPVAWRCCACMPLCTSAWQVDVFLGLMSRVV
eukprot:250864-Chlamydomonas_euryale.AAC.1